MGVNSADCVADEYMRISKAVMNSLTRWRKSALFINLKLLQIMFAAGVT